MAYIHKEIHMFSYFDLMFKILSSVQYEATTYILKIRKHRLQVNETHYFSNKFIWL